MSKIKRMNDEESRRYKLMEELAEAVHKAYCQYQKDVKGKEYWTKGDYNKLKDIDREADRYSVKAVLKVLYEKRLLSFRSVAIDLLSMPDKQFNEETL